MKLCFLFGHRDAPESLFVMLEEAVERAIMSGADEFLTGSRGKFDAMAARALGEAKKKHPEIRLFLLISYHPAENPPPLPPGFDGYIYPPDMERVPRRFAIVRANRYAVERAEHIITYVNHAGGNSINLMKYAQGMCVKRGIKIDNLGTYTI